MLLFSIYFRCGKTGALIKQMLKRYYIYNIYELLALLLEKEMASHSNILAWRIPGMEEPGGLPSMGSRRVRHDWSDLAAAAAALLLENINHFPLTRGHLDHLSNREQDHIGRQHHSHFCYQINYQHTPF